MKKPFDATSRGLFELDPVDWFTFLLKRAVDPGRISVVDSDVSTVTAAADKVLWIADPSPWIVHVELQASRDKDLAERLLHYNVLLRHRHNVPVRSVVVLLRLEADAPELSGTLLSRLPGAGTYLWFRYDTVRVWQQPVEAMLAGGLTTLPLAPVADVSPEDVQRVLVAIGERFQREATSEQGATLWAATRVFLGLRYGPNEVRQFIERVRTMILGIRGIEESSVYQEIFAKGETKGKVEGEAKGRVEQARDDLLSVGRKKLGEPDARMLAEIEAMTDLERLHSLLVRLLNVSNWDELLATAPSGNDGS